MASKSRAFRRLRVAILLAAFAISTLSACGGSGGNGGGGPTVPIGRTVIVTYGLFNFDFRETIQEVDLSFDGQIINRFVSDRGSTLASLLGTASNVRSGNHTVAVTMARQTRSPSRYMLGGEVGLNHASVFDAQGRSLGTIAIGPAAQVVSLSTGQRVSYTIAIP